MIDRLFLRHPRALGESYAAHAGAAGRFGLAMIVAGLACLVHAVVPALFTSTGSDAVRRLHARLGARRAAAHAPGQAAEWQPTYDI